MDQINRRIKLQTCREQHESLRILLERFPETVPLDAKAVSSLLQRVATLLFVHLKLEDADLYPALARSADRTIRETAARYSQEMGGLRDTFAAFIASWSSEAAIAAQPDKFLEAWGNVRTALEIRMAKEDHGLYSIAEEYFV